MARWLTVPLLLMLCACATIRRGPAPLMPITSDPPGAQIVLDGIDRGRTPAALPVQGNENHQLVLKKDCYADESLELRRDFGFGMWFFGNLLLPVGGHIVDLATGSAWRSSPQSVNVKLEPRACS